MKLHDRKADLETQKDELVKLESECENDPG